MSINRRTTKRRDEFIVPDEWFNDIDSYRPVEPEWAYKPVPYTGHVDQKLWNRFRSYLRNPIPARRKSRGPREQRTARVLEKNGQGQYFTEFLDELSDRDFEEIAAKVHSESREQRTARVLEKNGQGQYFTEFLDELSDKDFEEIAAKVHSQTIVISDGDELTIPGRFEYLDGIGQISEKNLLPISQSHYHMIDLLQKNFFSPLDDYQKSPIIYLLAAHVKGWDDHLLPGLTNGTLHPDENLWKFCSNEGSSNAETIMEHLLNLNVPPPSWLLEVAHLTPDQRRALPVDSIGSTFILARERYLRGLRIGPVLARAVEKYPELLSEEVRNSWTDRNNDWIGNFDIPDGNLTFCLTLGCPLEELSGRFFEIVGEYDCLQWYIKNVKPSEIKLNDDEYYRVIESMIVILGVKDYLDFVIYLSGEDGPIGEDRIIIDNELLTIFFAIPNLVEELVLSEVITLEDVEDYPYSDYTTHRQYDHRTVVINNIKRREARWRHVKSARASGLAE